jgi:hypothetical protein
MRTALLGLAVAIAVGTVVLVLSGSEPRRSGTNNVPGGGEIAQLDPGDRRCQAADVPGGTGRVAVPAYSPAGEPVRLAVTVRSAAGGARSLGSTSAVAPDGDPLAPLEPAPPSGAAEVCVRNAGAGRVALLGISNVFGVDFYPRSDQSWWQAAPAVARHFGFGKSGLVGAWALWLALALVLGAWIAAWRALASPGARA